MDKERQQTRAIHRVQREREARVSLDRNAQHLLRPLAAVVRRLFFCLVEADSAPIR